MPVIYEKSEPDEVINHIARGVMLEHHPELKLPDDTYPTLAILWASCGAEDDDAPVKWQGYPAAAVISIIPYKQRVDKRADAEIIVDKKHFEKLSDLQQKALIDHEITHLQISLDDQGYVKTDDNGRPKLKLRLHDWQLGGFRSIAKRYGADALETMGARAFEKEYGADVLAKDEALFG